MARAQRSPSRAVAWMVAAVACFSLMDAGMKQAPMNGVSEHDFVTMMMPVMARGIPSQHRKIDTSDEMTNAA